MGHIPEVFESAFFHNISYLLIFGLKIWLFWKILEFASVSFHQIFQLGKPIETQSYTLDGHESLKLGAARILWASKNWYGWSSNKQHPSFSSSGVRKSQRGIWSPPLLKKFLWKVLSLWRPQELWMLWTFKFEGHSAWFDNCWYISQALAQA